MSKMIEYGASSLTRSGGADLDGKDASQIRRDVVAYWDEDSDLVCIWRATDGRPLTGYIGFNRRTDLYFWISADGVCRSFNPKTGALGKQMKIPNATATKDLIKRYEKRIKEFRYGISRTKQPKKRVVKRK